MVLNGQLVAELIELHRIDTGNETAAVRNHLKRGLGRLLTRPGQFDAHHHHRAFLEVQRRQPRWAAELSARLLAFLTDRYPCAYNECCTQFPEVPRMPRLDIRLDHDCRARLDAVVEDTGLSASEIIRNLIDQAYEDVLKKERQNAFERLISLNIETPPDPAELSRELEEAHAPGHIY